MDRYKIAVGRKIQAFRFPMTQSTARTVRYIDFCVKNKAAFIADNIPVFILESAMVKVSRTTGIPIVVKSKEKARVLATAYSHKNIHSIETLRSNDTLFPYLIYYDCTTLLLNSKTYLKISTTSS